MELNTIKTVLIVDDDFLVREMTKAMLHELGYQSITEASNGQEALMRAYESRPDIVLMDIEMPVMDGITATSQLLQRQPTPVVMLTAYENQELVQRASAAGAAAYLIKPPNLRELERSITIAVARFEDLMELRRLNEEKAAIIKQLEQALANIKQLQGLIPICTVCKKIRDDEGYWQRLEIYLKEHSSADFTHSLCPDCLAQALEDIEKDAKDL